MPGCLNTQGAYADRNNAARAITDLRGLEHATGLTRLVLSNNPITDLAPIAGLTSLTELTLARGRVSDLTPIAGLTNLERLHLSNNQIDSSQLTHLTGLSSLKRLSLSGNRITSLTSLSGLTGLTHLSLYGNGISDLSPLSGLTNLIDLLLDYNDITDIEPLRRMTALSLLRLEGNLGLRDISPLSGLTSLSRLDLDVTGIEDIQPLVDNPGLASGDTVDLRDTPHLNARRCWARRNPSRRGIGVFTNENRWVQNVGVASGVRQLEVTWDSLTDYNPQGYKVQWRSGDQDYSDTASPARHHIVIGAGTTSYTIPDLTPDTEYTVRIRADNGDDYGGPPSAEATGTPLAPPPGQVTDVTVTPGVGSLIVSWTEVTDANGYKVQWKSGGQDYDATTRQGRVSGADTTSDTIPGLIPGTEYTVRVIATKAGTADGTPSAEATGTPSAVATDTPLAPLPGQVTDVTVTPGGESLIVSWTAVTDANGYKVQWKSGGQDYDATTRQDRVSGADTTSYTIPGLIPGTEYTVRVIATKAGTADGPPSAEATGAPARRVTVSIVRNAAAVEGAAVEFPIRLDGPSMVMVTLTWATEGGTAQPGEDFRAVATGSLTLRPGDRAGMLRVRTLDDWRVEPAETFRVRLTGATNADVDPRAASRTGTITDNDTETARRRALSMVLAGMGRRIAADTVDAVEERFNQPPAGVQVILGGRALTDAVTGAGTGLVRGVRDADRPGLEPLGATGRPAGYEHGPRYDGFDRGSPAEANEWMTWTPGEGFRRASALELLSRSRFDLSPSRQDDTGAADWSLWGRGTAGRFEGKPETGFGMDGEVFGGFVGLDYRLDRDVLLGVAVAHTRGDADYEIDAVTAGVVDLELTSVLPYAHWKPRPDLGVWALLGTGQGEVELKDEAGRVETDLEMLTVAFGLRQEVVTWQGIDVAFKADAFLTELETAAARELPEATGKARRLRLWLEGRTQWEISDVSQMTPSLEIGGRWDGGDAETGLGMEVAGGLAYAHTRLGLEVEAQGRFLLAHRKTAFDEYGGSLTAKLDPGQAGRGLWLAFAPGWGAEGSRVTQIWDGTGGIALGPERR